MEDSLFKSGSTVHIIHVGKIPVLMRFDKTV
jgi:hypothetical protein